MWHFDKFFSLDSFAQPWMHSHAQLPTPLVLDSNSVRVFFASRDKKQYSSIGFVDLTIDNRELKIKNVSKHPVLSPGPIGFFDEHGVFPSCVVKDHNRWLMYFIGWNKGFEPTMFYASIGVAESYDGINFERLSKAPLLSRSTYDPCLVTSPNIVRYKDFWLMTYVSGIGWFHDKDGQLHSRYHIKTARGTSLLDWSRDGNIAIDLREGETNVARSSVVLVRDGILGMWFSFVHSQYGSYRIGYAESNDGINWNRNDEASGIAYLPDFGNEMLCYPNVFDLDSRRWMLINGNGFGANGFGVALWDAN
jgi:predicted GH43/DUF377 family glycosyl hydrolase